MIKRFDAIIIGAGQAGPSLAVRLAGAGPQGCDRRAQGLRGHVRQHRLHADEDVGGKRLRGPLARRATDYGVIIDGAIRVDMKKVKARKDAVVARASQGVEKWLRSTDNVTVIQGHARFVAPDRLRVATAHRSAADLPQRRRTRARSADARTGRGAVPHELDDHGHRRAAGTSSDRRRQLHRARVRAGLSALRCASDGHREGAADHRPRGSGGLAGDSRHPDRRRHRHRNRRRVHGGGTTRRAHRRPADCDGGKRGSRRLASAARRRPDAEYRRSRS